MWLLSIVGHSSVACADAASTGPLFSALSTGVPCSLLGDCARFDALGVDVGSTLGLAQSPSHSLLLTGRARASVSMLDALEVSVSLGAQRDNAPMDASVLDPCCHSVSEFCCACGRGLTERGRILRSASARPCRRAGLGVATHDPKPSRVWPVASCAGVWNSTAAVACYGAME